MSLAESPTGRLTRKSQWVPDAEAPLCMICGSAFSFVRRRHHCRSCGRVVCGGCSGNRRLISGYDEKQRACDDCFAISDSSSTGSLSPATSTSSGSQRHWRAAAAKLGAVHSSPPRTPPMDAIPVRRRSDAASTQSADRRSTPPLPPQHEHDAVPALRDGALYEWRDPETGRWYPIALVGRISIRGGFGYAGRVSGLSRLRMEDIKVGVTGLYEAKDNKGCWWPVTITRKSAEGVLAAQIERKRTGWFSPQPAVTFGLAQKMQIRCRKWTCVFCNFMNTTGRCSCTNCGVSRDSRVVAALAADLRLVETQPTRPPARCPCGCPKMSHFTPPGHNSRHRAAQRKA
eukprot:TRINITY_DN6758_c0_g1_i3.p1 TRINITY_DN6758_c0_g1~~TRINITY_DN6758_c0_g1_i3.p1  ORF type:complete len:368 (+),score=86.87 TRINITY_DN6758_c0_g1_i3:74-1105(+)